MSNIVPLFVCLCVGIVLGQRRWLPRNAPIVRNSFILFVSLPALILLQVHDIHLQPELRYPVAMPWLLFVIGCGFSWPLGRVLRLPDTTTGGLAFKLLIAPALLGIVYVGWLHAHGETIRITLFESAMGPMIGGAIVAMQNGLNPPLITLMVGFGITRSFLTLPGWRYLLGAV